MRSRRAVVSAALVTAAVACMPDIARGQDAEKLSRDYALAVAAVNKAHADKPVAKDEGELGKQLPASAAKLVAELLRCGDAPEVRDALATAAAAALDLDRLDDFAALRDRLVQLDGTRANEIGIALSRLRFLAIATGGVEPECLTRIADVFDLVLDAYADVFGLRNFSKVPGKKLRLRIHLEAKTTRPPHFAPQFPFHSEIDFPVIDGEAFASPTKDGQFLFYGLCHELGHVIAMWGDRQNEEDRHAWAHYTGVLIVENLAKTKKDAPALEGLRDSRWRTLDFERKRLEAATTRPGGKDVDAVLARLVALHDAVGPAAIGEAINALDAAKKHELVNRVRYYRMADFAKSLLATKAGKAKKKAIDAAFVE